MNLNDALQREIPRAVERVSDQDDSTKNVNIIVSRGKEQTTDPYVMVFYRALQPYMLDNTLTYGDVKTIMGLCEMSRFGNLLSYTQAGLADLTGLSVSTVQRSIQKLIKLGFILDTKMGRFLNPTIVSKGGFEKIEEELWDAALKAGFSSTLRSVAKKQAAAKKYDLEPDDVPFN